MILSVSKHYALTIASSTTGIKNVCQIVHARTLIQRFHLSLSRKIFAQLDKILEVKGSRIVGADTYTGIKDDNTLQRRTESKDTMCLVILILLAYKKKAHLTVVNHILYLLLAACSIERYRAQLNTISTKISIKIMHTILGENSYLVVRFCPNVKQSIAHLFHSQRKLIPRHRLPLIATKLLKSKGSFIAIFLGQIVNQYRKMTIDLHKHNVLYWMQR